MKHTSNAFEDTFMKKEGGDLRHLGEGEGLVLVGLGVSEASAA